jgi:hypothetical protein
MAVIATAHLSSFVSETLGQEVAMYGTRAQQSHCYVACQLLYPEGIEVTLATSNTCVITII